ncbi:MAG TPA: tRNA uridine-5-carboxymethylaminomethyl(34) synthesis GTPase MnmE [Myxococcota bacterium]|nr:tRNA uridine-5-carboxymethylaminomethyl(34) synthesis GTPase MnmE [Myxococcota bacterium]HOC98386.1 tRNA uridine-5-carboxymethylaminomethyl(34) synthesis GTPase MnmE [Myxococcota bacterium]HPV03517.1 tRNA uridine-5-carboxymethylaminomethyl(34) synthesis GTPase MnmE [Myxococcota bacterium]
MAEEFGDVIVAPASGAGSCAVSVIRLSGAGSARLVSLLCEGGCDEGHDQASGRRDRFLRLAWLRHPSSGRRLDQAMVVTFAAGASFTGEESAEIFCHGGPVIVDSIVRACLDLGARHAGPGDFTRRALASGRIDLVQAEAVSLLSGSESDAATDVGLEALAGRPSEQVSALSERLLDILAEYDASMDFDSSDGVYVDLSPLPAMLSEVAATMDSWLESARAVRPAVTGFRVVLAGPPNVGKSTLFNAIAGSDRAIVHERPGTTRDVITERLVLSGVGCLLFDTAGIRNSDDDIEAEGVNRAFSAAASADLLLHVVDCAGNSPALPKLLSVTVSGAASHALVLARADLCARPPEIAAPGIPVFVVSARTGQGIPELTAFISDQARKAVASASRVSAVVSGERQVQAVAMAQDSVRKAVEAGMSSAPAEVTASLVRMAVQSLGEVTGASITDQVLDRIFSRFCIGK